MRTYIRCRISFLFFAFSGTFRPRFACEILVSETPLLLISTGLSSFSGPALRRAEVVAVIITMSWLPDVDNVFLRDRPVAVNISVGDGQLQEMADEELRGRRGEERRARGSCRAKIDDNYRRLTHGAQAGSQRCVLVRPVNGFSAPQPEQGVHGSRVVVEDGASHDRAHLPGAPGGIA